METARNLFGRREIETDVPEITKVNVLEVLSQAYTDHLINRNEIKYLYDYYKGKQPVLDRVKAIRPEINNKIVENRSNAIVKFRVGYTVGRPIQYVSASGDDGIGAEISKLNDMMRSIGKAAKDKELCEWQMICGVGYRLVLPESDSGKRIPFRIYTLDPRNTFTIRRSDYTREALAAVTYATDRNENITYTVYTPRSVFTIKGAPGNEIVAEAKNEIGIIPIVEYKLNMECEGAFEPCLSLLDALNSLNSNRLDSIEQFVQSLLVTTNCTFDDGITANDIREAGMVALKSVGENKADIRVISESLDQSNTQTLKDDIVKSINEIAGIPSQGNASTGDSSNNGAVVLKNGWQGAETKAQDYESMFKASEQEFLNIIAKLSYSLGDVSFIPEDIEIKFTRRNYDDLLSKSQTLITMLGSEKVHPKCAYEASNLFTDTQEAYNLGMEWYATHGANMADGGGDNVEDAGDSAV